MPDLVPLTEDRFGHDVRAAGKPYSGLGTLAVGVIVIAALYVGREVFVPLSVAILFSFALGPIVMLLRRWHFGRVPSVAAAMMFAILMISAVGALMGSQLAQLAENLPQYEANIAQKIQSLRGTATDTGVVSRATVILKELGNDITKPAELAPGRNATVPAARPAVGETKPVPVVIEDTDLDTMQIIERIVGPLLQPITTVGIVIVFVLFFLLQREDLRDRFIRLAGSHDLRRTTVALDDAAHRLSRYLLVQTAINASFGLVIGVGLWLIGVPNPILLGALAMLLRFVPYLGGIMAGAFAGAVAVAVDPGWSMLLWTFGLFAVVDLITGQIVEPHLYAHSTGLSAFAVIVAAVFWTWLWGPIGLLLSTPLTVCLVVLGRHVDRLEFLQVMLGNQPALAPEERFYQRILAGDPDEAAHQAERFLAEKSLSAYYDEVAVKGLALAQFDVNRGMLDHQLRVDIKAAIDGIIDDLSDYDDAVPTSAKGTDEAAASLAPALTEGECAPEWGKGAVMCIAGRGSLDEAAASMLAQLLEKHGIGAQVAASAAVSVASLHRLNTTGVQLACLSYLEPGGYTNARYLVRRLRRKLPAATIVVGFWTLNEDGAELSHAVAETGADLVVTSLRKAVEVVVSAASQSTREQLATVP
jgi:predicted PurR-regulated permease PerM